MQLLDPRMGQLFWRTLIVIFIGIYLFAFINLIRYKYVNVKTKIIWLLIIILVPILGPIIYLVVGKNVTFVTEESDS